MKRGLSLIQIITFIIIGKVKSLREKLVLLPIILALENIEDFQYINSNKENLELIDVRKLLTSYENKNYAFVVINVSKNQLKSLIKTSIQNKEIIRNLNLKFDSTNKNRMFI